LNTYEPESTNTEHRSLPPLPELNFKGVETPETAPTDRFQTVDPKLRETVPLSSMQALLIGGIGLDPIGEMNSVEEASQMQSVNWRMRNPTREPATVAIPEERSEEAIEQLDVS